MTPLATYQIGRITLEDIAGATYFIDHEYGPTCSPEYIERHRERLIRMMAVAEMQKREHAEWKSGVTRFAGHSAPLRAEPPRSVSGLRRAAVNARKEG